MLAVIGKRWGPVTLHGIGGFTVVSGTIGPTHRVSPRPRSGRHAHAGRVTEVVSDFGALDAPAARMAIDAAAGVSVTRSSPDLGTTLGLTFRF